MQQAVALTGQAACFKGAAVTFSARRTKQIARKQVNAPPGAPRALT